MVYFEMLDFKRGIATDTLAVLFAEQVKPVFLRGCGFVRSIRPGGRVGSEDGLTSEQVGGHFLAQAQLDQVERLAGHVHADPLPLQPLRCNARRSASAKRVKNNVPGVAAGGYDPLQKSQGLWGRIADSLFRHRVDDWYGDYIQK